MLLVKDHFEKIMYICDFF